MNVFIADTYTTNHVDPAHDILGMPALSPTMTQGNIAGWKVKEGDMISPGQVIAEIETDKATIDWESVDEFYIAKILKPTGTQNITVGTPVAVVVTEEEDVAKFADYVSTTDAGHVDDMKVVEHNEDRTSTTEEPSASVSPSIEESQTFSVHHVVPDVKLSSKAPSVPSEARIFSSPLARKIAAENSISISTISGTGPGGRIVVADIQEARMDTSRQSASPHAQTVSSTDVPQFEDIPLTNIRRIIADRLLESKQTVPHYYLSTDVRMDNILAARAQINKDLEANGQKKLSVNDFVIKASALALKSVPAVNSAWMGEFIRQYNTVDISVAVQTDYGLVVPIVKGADDRNLTSISSEVRLLAAKARDNKLAPHEFMGGTFTISNLGMFGVKQFCAIINPPQAAILAVGCSTEVLLPSLNGDGTNEKANIMTVTLSCDHRVVDGAVGAQWLGEFKKYMEHPIKMLV